MDNVLGKVLKAGSVVGTFAWELIKIGAIGLGNQYLNQQYKKSSGRLIKEVEDGVDYQVKRLKIIKHD